MSRHDAHHLSVSQLLATRTDSACRHAWIRMRHYESYHASLKWQPYYYIPTHFGISCERLARRPIILSQTTKMTLGQVTSAIEPGMTYTHSKLYDSLPKSSLCQDSYSRGSLTPIKVGCPSSRSPLYLTVPSHFRFRHSSACPRLRVLSRPVAVNLDQFQGEEKPWGRSGPERRRSGVLIAIVAPPCDSPRNRGGVPCIVASPSLVILG